MRASLPGEVGEEQEAVAARRNRRRPWRPGRSKSSPGANASRNQRRLPAADSMTVIMCQRPGTAWQNAWTWPAGSRSGPSVVANTTPDVPSDSATTPGPTAPTPTALAAWSPPPATTGVPARSPVAAAALAVRCAGDLRSLKGRRHPGRIDAEGLRAPRRPVARGEVEQQRPGPVRLVEGMLARSAEGGRSPLGGGRARSVPRSSGSWSRTHTSFGAVNPGKASLPVIRDQPLGPDRASDLRRMLRPCAGRSTGSPAAGRHRPQSSRTRPCIWPVETDRRDIHAVDAGAGQYRPDRA